MDSAMRFMTGGTALTGKSITTSAGDAEDWPVVHREDFLPRVQKRPFAD